MFANILSVVSALVYVAATALQQLGTFKAKKSKRSFVIALALTPIFLAGFALALVGFGMHIAALAIGSLAAVSTLQASQVIFMLPFGAWVSKQRITGREYFGAACTGVGIIGIVLFGQITSSDYSPPTGQILWATIASTAVFWVFIGLGLAIQKQKSAFFGVASGVAYGLMASLIKGTTEYISHHGFVAALEQPTVYLAILAAASAFVVQAYALSAGKLSVALSAILVATPVATTILAITVFHEEFLSSGFDWPALGLSVVAAAAGVVILSKSGSVAAVGGDSTAAAPADPAAPTAVGD